MLRTYLEERAHDQNVLFWSDRKTSVLQIWSEQRVLSFHSVEAGQFL